MACYGSTFTYMPKLVTQITGICWQYFYYHTERSDREELCVVVRSLPCFVSEDGALSLTFPIVLRRSVLR